MRSIAFALVAIAEGVAATVFIFFMSVYPPIVTGIAVVAVWLLVLAVLWIFRRW